VSRLVLDDVDGCLLKKLKGGGVRTFSVWVLGGGVTGVRGGEVGQSAGVERVREGKKNWPRGERQTSRQGENCKKKKKNDAGSGEEKGRN